MGKAILAKVPPLGFISYGSTGCAGYLAGVPIAKSLGAFAGSLGEAKVRYRGHFQSSGRHLEAKLKAELLVGILKEEDYISF